MYKRQTQIIRTNADRVSGIIDNVQRLSRREAARIERFALAGWTEEFQEEFAATMQWPRTRLTVSSGAQDIEVRVDPDQLRQILWNPVSYTHLDVYKRQPFTMQAMLPSRDT